MQDALGPLERDSTVARVAQAIREGIISGKIEQGTRLGISALASTLQTSQGSVREAIRELVTEGLVEHEPHRGAFVRVHSEADRLDVYRAREAVETWAVKQLVNTEAELDFAPLENLLARMHTTSGIPDEAVIEADMEFHHTIVRMAGSERLTALHETLAAETMILVRGRSPWPGTSYEPIHEQLLEAIRSRDPSAVDLVSHHLRIASQLITGPAPNAESDGPTESDGQTKGAETVGKAKNAKKVNKVNKVNKAKGS